MWPNLEGKVRSVAWFRLFGASVIICGVLYSINILVSEAQPYTPWGLSYGIAATILMMGSAVYGLRRRAQRIASKYRLGTTKNWLQFHVYGGSLSLLLVLMHVGFQLPSGTLTWWLFILTLWVILSGFAGVLLQKWIPKILASGLSLEVIYERIPELIEEIKQTATQLVEDCEAPVRALYSEQIAPLLEQPELKFIYYLDITGGMRSRLKEFEFLRGVLDSEEREKLDQLQALYQTKLELDAHYTLQKTMRCWLYAHVPLSLVLVVLIVWHVLAVWYY